MISQIFSSKFRYWLVIFLSVLVLSYVGYVYQVVNQIGFSIICLITVILTYKDIKFGLYIILAELFIGSKGYLFWLEISGTQVSLRLALFLIVLAFWLLYWFRKKSSNFLSSPFFRPTLFLAFFLLLGLVVGFIRNNDFSNIFFDVNGYLYLALIFLFFEVITSRNRLIKILQILAASLTMQAVFSLLLVYVFGHQFIFTMPSLYSWVREFGIGEITMVTSNYYRVFFQGQVFALYAFFFFLAWIFFSNKLAKVKKEKYLVWLLLLIASLIIVVSFSRSFWLGLAGGLLFFAILLVKPLRFPFSTIVKKSIISLLIVVTAVGLLFGLANFPFPKTSGSTSASLLKDRALDDLTSEAAAASRWDLLPILWDKVLEHPIIGSGFGATATYKTSDPRFLESHPDGLYTTFAFEWTYLDIWIKIGIGGLLAYFYLLFRIIHYGYKLLAKDDANNYLSLGFLTALIALLFLNLTTPYLNHPLGIGFFMLAAASFYLLNQPDGQLNEKSHSITG
ncbi:O-antigen ligase family protein [Patescibacteria group bacterium]|nr:O-antigen ligase family protein [Patescibacteria group bacterium]